MNGPTWAELLLGTGVLVLGGVLVGLWWAVGRLLRQAFTPRLFISYRRKDSRRLANRLHEILTNKYGWDVFLDGPDLIPGDTYPQQLYERLASSSQVLALVGPEWDGGSGAHGYPRILEDGDWVRHEVEYGHGSGRLLVVSVKDATGRTGYVQAYPDDKAAAWGRTAQNRLLKQVGEIQAVVLSDDGTDYREGVDKLNETLDRIFRTRYGYDPRRLVWWWKWGGLPAAVACVVLLVGVVYLEHRRAAEQITALQTEVARIAGEVQEVQQAVDKLTPVAVRPETFDQFAEKTQGMDKDEFRRLYRNQYVQWEAKYRKKDTVGGDTVLYLTSPTDRAGASAAVRLAPDAEFDREWGNLKDGDSVRMIGYVYDVEPLKGEYRLRGVRRSFPLTP